jgi:hypothetical protein
MSGRTEGYTPMNIAVTKPLTTNPDQGENVRQGQLKEDQVIQSLLSTWQRITIIWFME